MCGSPSTLISPFSSSLTSRTSCRTSCTSLRFVANHPSQLRHAGSLFRDLRTLREFCKNQRPDCNAFSEIGIICFSCWRNLKYKRSPTANEKANNDLHEFLASSLRIVLEDQSAANLNDKSCSSKLRRCLRYGSHPTILA